MRPKFDDEVFPTHYCGGKTAEELHVTVAIKCSNTGSSKIIPAKFSDTCSIRADGLCIGCLGQWAERGRENSNLQEIFCTTL